MKEEQDYIKDITEMRSMMERSSKFMSLSGLAGVLAGIYALAGSFAAYKLSYFSPDLTIYPPLSALDSSSYPGLSGIVFLGMGILVLAIGTAIFLSWRNAAKRGEKFWNSTAKRVLYNMAVPLVTGGLLILLLISRGLIGYLAPVSLLFYGLALFNASKFTYEEIKSLGLIEIGLGLIGCYFVEYGLLCWAAGFGLVHIVYGIYMHYRYER